MQKPIAAIVLIAVLAGCSGSRNASASDSAVVTPMSKPAANAELTERAADSVQSVGVPPAIADVGTHAEDLYDEAKAANWTKARVIMDSLDRSASKLKPSERSELAGALDTVRRAVTAHDRTAAVEGANSVTFIAAHLTEAYNPKMPADVVRLDYYGRELEIWAARNDLGRLASTRTALQRTWKSVKPNVIGHGGAAAAARTDSLVARLAAAKTAKEYAAVATPFLDVVDELEKPFEK
jgi:hypothetical protein